jgi:hypothetical protein
MSRFYSPRQDRLPSSRIRSSHLNSINDATTAAFSALEEYLVATAGNMTVAKAGVTISGSAYDYELTRTPPGIVHLSLSANLNIDSPTPILTIPAGFYPHTMVPAVGFYTPAALPLRTIPVQCVITDSGDIQVTQRLNGDTYISAGFYTFVGSLQLRASYFCQ